MVTLSRVNRFIYIEEAGNALAGVIQQAFGKYGGINYKELDGYF